MFTGPDRKKRKKKKKMEENTQDSTSSSSESDKDSDEEDHARTTPEKSKNSKNPKESSNNKKENSNPKKQKKSEHKPSGECKGMAGGNITINQTLKNNKKSVNSVATVLNFDVETETSPKTDSKKASEKQPKRGLGPNKKGYKSSILGQAIGKLLEKKKYSESSSDADADVEDELSETDLLIDKKPKKVQKSPEKSSDLPRYRRAAANKASDRINRESRGRLSLSSSSDEDSHVSDLGDQHELEELDSDDSDFKPVITDQPVVKIPLKRKPSSDSLETKPKNKKKVETIDQEKENKNNKMSWPEQLARSKQARAETRNSVDSLDSMEMEVVQPQKKAIVLPILGKKKLIKEDLKTEPKPPTPANNKAKPKSKKAEEPSVTDLPPQLEPQVTIPPIKKRLKQAETIEPVSKPKTSNKKPEVKKPQQMSIMAFVQKKKEEALEKKVSGYVSPASSSQEEDLKKKEPVIVPKVTKEPTRKVEEPKVKEVKEVKPEPVKDREKKKKAVDEVQVKEKKDKKDSKVPKDSKAPKEPKDQPKPLKQSKTDEVIKSPAKEKKLKEPKELETKVAEVPKVHDVFEFDPEEKVEIPPVKEVFKKSENEEIEVLSSKVDTDDSNKKENKKVKKSSSKESNKNSNTEDEFENMGYISGDEGYAPVKAIQPPAPIMTEAASEEELEPVVEAPVVPQPAEPIKPVEEPQPQQQEPLEQQKTSDVIPEVIEAPQPVEEPMPEQPQVEPMDQTEKQPTELNSEVQAELEAMKPVQNNVMQNEQQQQIVNQHPDQTQMYQPPPQQQQQQQQQQNDAMNNMGQTDLGPSLGVYTPESATNSVHSIHGGSFNNMGDGTSTSIQAQTSNDNSSQVHASNVMESPNSISSVDMNTTGNTNAMQQPMNQQQYNQQPPENMNQAMQQQQQSQQQHMQHVPQASPHNTMTAPSPAASVASNVHPPSIPSQSPHSNHNMTSPHPQPSPHQTSPHPMTISPAAHSPYQAAGQQQPQPQPSPQPSPLGQARQPERSPHLHYQQHSHQQMQHLQHMSRFYHPNYPNYAAAAAVTHPHHLGRLQAAGMPPMFPANPMFNLPSAVPTTPPKQSRSCSNAGQYAPPTTTVATTSNSNRSSTSLARLQQLTNGLENSPTSAKPSKPNSALLAPSYYPQNTGHTPQAGTHTGHGRPDTPRNQHLMHQYSQSMLHNYNYPGYLPYMNMYHQAAEHHQRAAQAHHQATHPGTGTNPPPPPHPHAHPMYQGYPGIPGYNYPHHR